MGLAWRSAVVSTRWQSELAVWEAAQLAAPTLPDPWVHGAMALLDVPGDPRDPIRLDTAEQWLTRATKQIWRQPTPEQAWARDAIAATTAVIRMRQGRLREAAALMSGAMVQTARGELCRHFASVCALADSSE